MDLERVVERIVAAGGDVVALTGAGVSAESGIPTFRDPGGLWDRFDPDVVGTLRGLLRFLVDSPWEGIEFLKGLRTTLADARPNAGHAALAGLERRGYVRSVVTQNVDRLHQAAGSVHVIELHGTFSRLRCMGCGVRRAADAIDELDQMIAKLGSYMVSHPAHLLHRCACGELMRFDFVACGEDVHDLERAQVEVDAARVLLVCGTSGVVYPAAALPDRARCRGAFVVEINPEPTEISRLADVRLEGASGEVLPSLVTRIYAGVA